MNLGWCEALTEEGIEALARNCPDLESVDLCGCLQACSYPGCIHPKTSNSHAFACSLCISGYSTCIL